ncbi:MAG: hypothetical protein LBE36_00800 [Flavobacteriaceae bacterium]|nr:hypothetical protein [Flavobacteriaceae bacterium]
MGLTGNSGTTPGTNFIGTTDNQPLILKTNNAEGLRLLSDGNVRIGADIDPVINGATLRLYRNANTSFEIANTYGRFELGKSYCNDVLLLDLLLGMLLLET